MALLRLGEVTGNQTKVGVGPGTGAHKRLNSVRNKKEKIREVRGRKHFKEKEHLTFPFDSH